MQPDQLTAELAVALGGALQCGAAVGHGFQIADDGVATCAAVAQQVQCFLHRFHRLRLEAPVRQQQLQALAQPWFAGEQQHGALAVVGLAAWAQVADHLQQRDFEPERRALAGHRGQADAALHQVDDALADRQPEAGAAVQAGGGGVGLGEGAEQPFLPVAVDADAGVAYFETQLVLGRGFAQPADVDLDAAALGELDGVDQQVAEHLA